MKPLTKTYTLYVITSPSKKQYVGITGLTIKRRWKDHICSANEGRKYAISCAIRKYGKDNFKIKTIKTNVPKNQISNLEKKHIEKLNTLFPNGYNIAEGGLYEVTWNEERLKKQSHMASVNNKKRFEDPEEKEKQKKIADKQWSDPEFKEKMANGSKKRYQNLEERKKSSERFKKLWQDPKFLLGQKIGRLKSKITSTPIELYNHKLGQYWVKREDLCCKAPLPPFSKVRGVVKHLVNLKKSGIDVVGYTETSISMAGIAVGCIAKQLDMKAVIFDPQYKETPGLLKKHRKEWKKHKAIIEPIKAGRAKVNYYIGRKILKEKYPDSIMLPLGLPFHDTVLETAKEVQRSEVNKFAAVVVNVGSGTITAGVLSGFASKGAEVIGVMGRTGSIIRKRDEIIKKAGMFDGGLFGKEIKFRLVDPGWRYTERCTIPVPFPCHPYYDAKAYMWMIQHLYNLPKPVLFWNIGAMPK